MADDLAETLSQVFAPFEEAQRTQLIAWASEELGTRSVITMLVDKRGSEWKVGEPSPSNENAVVFAILLDGPLRCADIYCVSFVEADGKQGVVYFKETCWDPQHTWGPLGANALWAEWSAFFGASAEGEAEEPKPNGADAH